ncbi:MAG: carbohydrate ABC transporter permease [Bacilli bacterium]|nr:carbohydrate ABC transporter permease [Bacilli bacterium]
MLQLILFISLMAAIVITAAWCVASYFLVQTKDLDERELKYVQIKKVIILASIYILMGMLLVMPITYCPNFIAIIVMLCVTLILGWIAYYYVDLLHLSELNQATKRKETLKNLFIIAVAILIAAAIALILYLTKSLSALIIILALCFLGWMAYYYLGYLKVSTVEQAIKRDKAAKVLKLIVVYTFLVVIAIYVVVPFYWMILTSLKTPMELNEKIQLPYTLNPQWNNYKVAIKQANFADTLVNTIIVGVISTAGSLIITIFAAFAFARLNFKGRDALFSMFMATMMIPGEMLTVTNYITVVKILGWKDSYQALIVPFLVSVFYIYLLRQTFKQIPDELYYAAKVDGTTDLGYLFKVMLPIATPTIITILLLKMMGSWNSYMWPNLVNSDQSASKSITLPDWKKRNWQLITNSIRGSFRAEEDGGTDQYSRITSHLQMAATTFVTAPLLLVFIFLRKYLMRGVSRSGIKG